QRWNQEGGGRELLVLALPLILSSSFLTLQLTIDRALLSQSSVHAVAASIPAALLYYVPMALLQFTAGYATTFVAQYVGAGRPRRVGPTVWQALYFSVGCGVGLLGAGAAAGGPRGHGRPLGGGADTRGGLFPHPVFRGLTGAGRGVGERLLLRPRCHLDRLADRRRRTVSQCGAGIRPDLRSLGLACARHRGRGLGDRDWFEHVGSGSVGTVVSAEEPGIVRPRQRLAVRSRVVRPAHAVRHPQWYAVDAGRTGVQGVPGPGGTDGGRGTGGDECGLRHQHGGLAAHARHGSSGMCARGAAAGRGSARLGRAFHVDLAEPDYAICGWHVFRLPSDAERPVHLLP